VSQNFAKIIIVIGKPRNMNINIIFWWLHTAGLDQWRLLNDIFRKKLKETLIVQT